MMLKLDRASETGWGFSGNVEGGADVEIRHNQPHAFHNEQTEIELGHRAPSLPGEIDGPDGISDDPCASGSSNCNQHASNSGSSPSQSRDAAKRFELQSSCSELKRLSQTEPDGSSWFLDVDQPAERSSDASVQVFANEFHSSEGTAVTYQKEWITIYTTEKYRPMPFRILASLFAIYFVGYGAYLIIQEHERTPDFFAQDSKLRRWAIYERAPLPVGGFISFLFLCFSLAPASQ